MEISSQGDEWESRNSMLIMHKRKKKRLVAGLKAGAEEVCEVEVVVERDEVEKGEGNCEEVVREGDG